MKTFDLGKTIPPAAYLFCDDERFQWIKNICQASANVGTDLTDLFTGIRIQVVEDANERKAAAIVESATSGLPVLYEDKDGFHEVRMPKSGFSPFRLAMNRQERPTP